MTYLLIYLATYFAIGCFWAGVTLERCKVTRLADALIVFAASVIGWPIAFITGWWRV